MSEEIKYLFIIIMMLISIIRDEQQNLLIKVNSFLIIFHLFNSHIFKHANADLLLGLCLTMFKRFYHILISLYFFFTTP